MTIRYILSLIAFKDAKILGETIPVLYHQPAAVCASGQDQAYHQGIILAERIYPKREGYYSHDATVGTVTENVACG